MDNLIKRLQDEAGLTEDQAIKSISIIRDFMNKEGIEIDWSKFVKGKYENFTDKAKATFNDLSQQAREYGNKISDKAEDLATEAKRTARDLAQKAADKLDDK